MKRQISAFFDLGFRTYREAAPSAQASDSALRSTGDVGPVTFNLEPQAHLTAANRRGPRPATAIVVFVVVVVTLSWIFPNWSASQALSLDPIAAATLLLMGGVLVLGAMATLLHFLRRQRNRLYWELACWVLVVIGIIVRQMVANGSPKMLLGAFAVSAVVGLAIQPGLMRWLNKITKEPGLQHVAVPFSLGFFVDLAQVLTSHYVVHLPWMPT